MNNPHKCVGLQDPHNRQSMWYISLVSTDEEIFRSLARFELTYHNPSNLSAKIRVAFGTSLEFVKALSPCPEAHHVYDIQLNLKYA